MNFIQAFGKAKYIGAGDAGVYPYIRKVFVSDKKIARATLKVSAHGFCEIYMNGKKVNDDLFVSTYSNYSKLSPDGINPYWKKDWYFNGEREYTVYISEYDVKKFINDGKNCIGFVLAGGWYNTGFDRSDNFLHYGNLKVCFSVNIEYADGTTETVLSDGDCKWCKNFLISSGVYHEEQDERLEITDFSDADYDDGLWDKVSLYDADDCKYFVGGFPKETVDGYFVPKLIKEGNNYKIYDAGKNITGYPVIITDGVKNASIVCEYSEAVTCDNELDEKHTFKQNSVFITDGRKTHNIRFTWHGFRYFKISYSDADLKIDCNKVAFVHSDVKVNSSFISDDETFNWLYNTFIHCQLCNYQCGVPTDCPHIERRGYTGDGQLLSEAGMLLFDSKTLYRKWLNDISDCQDKLTGDISYTAPIFVGCGGGTGGWGSAIVNVPYNFYKAFGDVDVLKEFFPKMLAWVGYMKSHSENGIVISGNPNAWWLGEWCTPTPVEIPHEYVNSCFLCMALLRIKEIAGIIGEKSIIKELDENYEYIKNAINSRFLDVNTGDYCNNTQGANVFAIKAGICDERTLFNTVNKYAKSKRFDTGIFGTYFLSEILLKNGYSEIFYDLITSDSEISFKRWKDGGATTLLESWVNARSYNHPMFGALVRLFFNYILGIRQQEGSTKFKSFIVNPLYFSKISNAKGGIKTDSGEIYVEFKREGGETVYNIIIPEDVKCKLVVGEKEIQLVAGKNEYSVKTEEIL